MSDKTYCYPPDYNILKNRLNIRDVQQLERVERRLVTQRHTEGIPEGDFDLAHLKAIHKHLFQDIYDWAGEIRTVEISKGGSQFQFRKFIETGMADIHRRIKAHDKLKNLPADQFSELAGEIIGDINYVHPFREGNGRTQLLYLEQLADQAVHTIDLRKIDQGAWMKASRQAHQGNYQPMSKCITDAFELDREQDHGDEEHQQ